MNKKNVTLVGALVALAGLSVGAAFLSKSESSDTGERLSGVDADGDRVFASTGALKGATSPLGGTWQFTSGGGTVTCGDIVQERSLDDRLFSLSGSGKGAYKFSDDTCEYELEASDGLARARGISCQSKQHPEQVMTIDEHRVEKLGEDKAKVTVRSTFTVQLPTEDKPRDCTMFAEGVAVRKPS